MEIVKMLSEDWNLFEEKIRFSKGRSN